MPETADGVFHFDKALDAWVCPIHGNVEDNTAWVPCYAGCDDGEIDAYEYDSLMYDEGDYLQCSACHGAGGRTVCGECNIDNEDAEF